MATFLRAASVVFLTMLAAKLLVAGAGAAVSDTTDLNIPRIYSYPDRALVHAKNTEITSVSIVAGVDAGVSPGSYNGDGILATNATLNKPTYATLDAQGNIFISDSRNSRIRRVDKNTGIITTVAGTGDPGFSGDGGLATLAGINCPLEITFDVFGDMFFYDFYSRRIRRITSTGIINTMVGTGEDAVYGSAVKFNGENILGTSTNIAYVAGLACDSEGNLFYSDIGFNRIRKLTRNTNIVNTVAGTGLDPPDGTTYNNVMALDTNIYPTYLVFDSSGNLYFNKRGTGFLKLTMTTGLITTVETNNRVIYVLIDGSDNFYYSPTFRPYVTLGERYEVRKIAAGSGLTTTVAYDLPKATYLDAAGALYIPVYANNTVLKYALDSGITAPPTRQPTSQSAPPTRPPVTVTAPPTRLPVTVTAPPTRPPVTVTVPPTRQSTPNVAPIRPSKKPTKCPRGKKPSRKPRCPPPRQ